MATWSDGEVTFFIGNDSFLVFLSFLSRSFIVNHVFLYLYKSSYLLKLYIAERFKRN